MLGSTGGVVAQPVLGRSADVWGYGSSYLLGAAISALALPFGRLSRRPNGPADYAVGIPSTVETPTSHPNRVATRTIVWLINRGHRE